MKYLSDSDRILRVLGAKEQIQVGDYWIYCEGQKPYFYEITSLNGIKQPMDAEPNRVPCVRPVGGKGRIDDHIKKIIHKLTEENSKLKKENGELRIDLKHTTTLAKSSEKMLDEWVEYDKILGENHKDVQTDTMKKWSELQNTKTWK